ncbi:hypothetical protein NPIL_30211 [Nephila pilipes]|uniref:Uncharacterized protein n=1 Tax=Nephila pilipes TaxID=299642 RepID=A0A8X6QIS4_NEPPI|nr:hypothetical protein NPIL_30211 [Nephila pilipes]
MMGKKQATIEGPARFFPPALVIVWGDAFSFPMLQVIDKVSAPMGASCPNWTRRMNGQGTSVNRSGMLPDDNKSLENTIDHTISATTMDPV